MCALVCAAAYFSNHSANGIVERPAINVRRGDLDMIVPPELWAHQRQPALSARQHIISQFFVKNKPLTLEMFSGAATAVAVRAREFRLQRLNPKIVRSLTARRFLCGRCW